MGIKQLIKFLKREKRKKGYKPRPYLGRTGKWVMLCQNYNGSNPRVLRKLQRICR